MVSASIKRRCFQTLFFNSAGKEKLLNIVFKKLLWSGIWSTPIKSVPKDKSSKEKVLKHIKKIYNLVCAKKRSTFNRQLEAFIPELNELFDISSHDAIDLTRNCTLLNAAQKNDDSIFL